MNQIVRYEAACLALAECKAIDEVKDWIDKSAAMQAYGRMANDKTLELDASEIRLRAERRLGQMIEAQKAEGGLNKGGRPPEETPTRKLGVSEAPTLAQVGISHNQSSRAQKLAAVPEAAFEAELAAKRERERQDGARVTARLEARGARELAKKDEEIGEVDPFDEAEKLLKQVGEMQAVIDAAEADDLKAEAMKWRRAYDNAVREQSAAMDRAKKAADREAWTMKQLRRCGKALGVDDPDKIAPSVEAFIREHRKAAA